MRVVLIALCFIGICYSADPLDEVRATFTYNRVPVHPGIVELFSNWMSDSPDPQILAVDLSTAQKSNRFDDNSYTKGDGGWVRTQRSDENDRRSFGYRFIGSLPTGTLVLHTYESGGGSGIFEAVMMLAVGSEQAVGADGGPRTRNVLRILRIVPIGDRANAVLVIDGSTVHIDRSRALARDQSEPLVLGDPQQAASSSPSP